MKWSGDGYIDSSSSARFFHAAGSGPTDSTDSTPPPAPRPPPIPLNLTRRPRSLPRIVAQLHRRKPLHRHQLAHQADRPQRVLAPRMAPAKVIRQQSPPASAEPYPPAKVLMQPN